jgi:hypothetical protein
MKQTLNAQRSTLNTQFSCASELEVGRWTLGFGRLLAVPV